jgi:pyoverdine/dityrosine biosynthesis protein Dit1
LQQIGFLATIRRFVHKGRPIRVLVSYGPLKNLNADTYSRADGAAFFAFCHLVAWHNKVQTVYPPGLQFQIVFDDETMLLANGADRGLLGAYTTSLAELIRVMGFQTVFLATSRLSHNA